jgi:hypothetical protein
MISNLGTLEIKSLGFGAYGLCVAIVVYVIVVDV